MRNRQESVGSNGYDFFTQSQGSKALDQYLDLVKGDTVSNLVGMGAGTLSSNIPKDATVHELTSNTIWFIEHLFEHYDVIGGILQLDSSYTSQINLPKIQSAEDRNKAILGLYISELSQISSVWRFKIQLFFLKQKKSFPN